MISYPELNPVAVQVGPLAVHWYGLMYLVGFVCGWALLAFRIKRSPCEFTQQQLSDILFYSALGIIIGGRLGYMLFYDFSHFIHYPLAALKIWQGGMSFHGGLLGVFVALSICGRKINKSVGDITDFIAPVVPIGLGAGRIGNFINDELWGRVTDVPWAVLFPNGGYLPRHPSQLYEFFLEGIVLFIILWTFSIKKRPRWAVSGLFLICYGIFRFCVEFFREPDSQIGFVAFGWLTKGQLLSVPMVLIGLLVMKYAYQKR